MALNVRYLPEIVDDREKLSEGQWRVIESRIEEVREEGTSHEDVKLVPNSSISHPVWELKIEDDNTDHRVFLDIDSGTLIILAIWDFDFTHSGEGHWNKLEDRMTK